MSGDPLDPQRTYGERRAAREAEHAAVDRRHRAVGLWRLACLAATGALAAGAIGGAAYSAWWIASPLPVLFWLGVRLDRIEGERSRLARAIAFYVRGQARLRDAWVGTGDPGADFADPAHLYAADVDVFGAGSLFERVSVARTHRGRATLAAWLLHPAPPEVVARRQEAVAELASNLDLREDLAVVGDETRAAVDAEALRTWAAAPPAFPAAAPWRLAWIASCGGALALAAGIAYALAAGRSLALGPTMQSGLGWYFIGAIVAVAIVTRRAAPVCKRVLAGVGAAARDVTLLGALLARLEPERFRARHLVALRAALETGGEAPSRQVQRLARLIDYVDSRRNAFASLFGFFLLWDLHLARAVERWRLTCGPALGTWLDTAGEMEALASLAAYRFECPGHVWPEFAEGPARFVAAALGHPLLPAEAVANDVRLGDGPQVLVLSGSNMSGKSTLLRAIGATAALAQAGAPVRARRLRMSPLAVGASIRILDSLQGGSSRFHAEITRLHAILERSSAVRPSHAEATVAAGALRDGNTTLPVLFLIDECLHGTNSHDRLVGARAIVTGLVERGAIGVVTTHDLALTRIAEPLGRRAANVHFRDRLIAGRLCFDYTLRPGVVTRGNALALMREVGFDV